MNRTRPAFPGDLAPRLEASIHAIHVQRYTTEQRARIARLEEELATSLAEKRETEKRRGVGTNRECDRACLVATQKALVYALQLLEKYRGRA